MPWVCDKSNYLFKQSSEEGLTPMDHHQAEANRSLCLKIQVSTLIQDPQAVLPDRRTFQAHKAVHCNCKIV